MSGTEHNSPPDAPVWRALADPTRRQILDELRAEPMPVGELASRFDMTRFGVMKHIKILQDAGLLVTEAKGRERWNRVNPGPIRELYRRWILPFEEEHADRALRLKDLAERKAKMNDTATLSTADVVLELTIDAPIEKVWSTLVDDTSAWWHKDFYTNPNPKSFHIETRLGGRMYEDWGDGAGQLWGDVMGIQAPAYLQVVGDTSKDWGGPNRGIMTWKLSEVDGKTRFRLDHSLFGNVSEKTRESLEGGWKFLFETCMKAYIETGKKPDPDKLAAPECKS